MTDAHSDSATKGRDQDWGETLDRLRAFIAARVGDPDLAADITQDILVRSIASGALDRVDNVGAWLYAAARNAVIDHYRQRHRHDGVADLERWPEPDTSDNLPNAATRELARCLTPMLGQLHPVARDALTRVDLDGQTHREAAAQLGISVSGMKSRVQRGRRELKNRLTSCCQIQTDHSGALADYSSKADACGCNGDDVTGGAAGPEPRASACARPGAG